jgi:hypothetical protein
MNGEARGRRLGLATVLGLKPRGFFLPHRHADAIAAPQPPYATVETTFGARHSTPCST